MRVPGAVAGCGWSSGGTQFGSDGGLPVMRELDDAPGLSGPASADSLEEAGDKLFTFTRLPQSQWKSARTTNAIDRLNEEFKRRIKTQAVLPSRETVPMLFRALMASGQIQMRKVDGWETLHQPLVTENLDPVA